jgi:hypothetical protein
MGFIAYLRLCAARLDRFALKAFMTSVCGETVTFVYMILMMAFRVEPELGSLADTCS